MAVAVLSPQDCLPRHHHHHRHLISPANKPRRNPNPNPNPNTSPTRSARRTRTSPTRSKSPPAIPQIRILKRGEDLSPPRRDSEPISIPIQIPDGFYAGSAFFTSPPPSDVPLPAFFTKRNCGVQNQEIASELRKVLKLI